jgi:hypothetical protein
MPICVPGQSLDGEIQRVRNDALYDYPFVPLVLGMIFAFALLQWRAKTPPATVASISGSALVFSLFYALPTCRKARERVKRLRQGQAGERAKAEYLDTLREDGTRTPHDLVGDGFNLDHVLVSRHGIFTIETKTISKQTTSDQQITFDGEQILIEEDTSRRVIRSFKQSQAVVLA